MNAAPLPTLILLLALGGCRDANTVVKPVTEDALPTLEPVFAAGPHVLVYRTHTDLADKVPVMLSDDGSTVVSYPDPADLRHAHTLPLPTSLHQGYLLDNRGIGVHVAFLNISYADYAARPAVPSQAELIGMIVDKDPLTELCDCGNRTAFTNVEAQLDQLIDAGKLRSVCKVVK